MTETDGAEKEQGERGERSNEGDIKGDGDRERRGRKRAGRKLGERCGAVRERGGALVKGIERERETLMEGERSLNILCVGYMNAFLFSVS